MHFLMNNNPLFTTHFCYPELTSFNSFLFFLFSFFFLTSLLEYNCFTTVCQFLVYNKVNQLYIYTYVPISLPSCVSLPPTLPIPPLFSFLTSLLEYNCFTKVCQFLLYNKVNQLYIHVYPHISSLLRLPPSHQNLWIFM